MSRNQSIAGLAILAVFLVLVISGSVFALREWQNRQAAGIGQRHPLPRLGYCAPGQPHPCIESFQLDETGDMLINFVTERSVPDFRLEIRQEDLLTHYACLKDGMVPTSVTCTGETMPVGESLEFVLFSKKDDSLLAEGTFAILGIALATPDIATTPTHVPLFDRPPR